MVTVSGGSSSVIIQVQIPAEYYPHLIWIRKESEEATPRGVWLRHVLDHFAEELGTIKPSADSKWRSVSLHCLLVRAYNAIDNTDKATMTNVVKSQVNPEAGRVTKDLLWEFYTTSVDVVDSRLVERWKIIKPHGFISSCETPVVDDENQGVASSFDTFHWAAVRNFHLATAPLPRLAIEKPGPPAECQGAGENDLTLPFHVAL
jgi:hypothetical protein